MEQINKFNTRINEIEKIENLDEKSKNVKEVKGELKTEQERIENMIDKISNIKAKKSKKYKSKSLQQLQIMFEEEKELEEKLKIYQQICYLIELTKNQLFEEA